MSEPTLEDILKKWQSEGFIRPGWRVSRSKFSRYAVIEFHHSSGIYRRMIEADFYFYYTGVQDWRSK